VAQHFIFDFSVFIKFVTMTLLITYD